MKARKMAVWITLMVTGLAGTGVLMAQKASAPATGVAVTADDGDSVAAGPDKKIERHMFIMGGEGSWLGVGLSDVTPEKAKEMQLPGEYGAIVQEVRDDSPAAKAGLQKGDVILSFAGEKVHSVAELRRLVQETPPGRTVSMEVSRAGRNQTLTAKLGEYPEGNWMEHFEMPHIEIPDVHIPNFDFDAMFAGEPRLGISADDLTPQLAGYFGVKGGKGVLVREVEDGTPAQKGGLKAGDVIVKAGDKEIASVAELRRALPSASEQKQSVMLTLVRDKKELTVNVEMEAAKLRKGPRSVAELRDLGVSKEDIARMKAEIDKAAREVNLDKEKIQSEIQSALKEHQKDIDRAKKEIEMLRHESLCQLI